MMQEIIDRLEWIQFYLLIIVIFTVMNFITPNKNR